MPLPVAVSAEPTKEIWPTVPPMLKASGKFEKVAAESTTELSDISPS